LIDENVFVFVTHEHQDHFDTVIYDWKDKISNINYIFGCQPEYFPEYRDSGYTGPAYEYMAPHEHREFGNMKVSTIDANDAGVGFLIEIDGLRIYHAGDHAGWREGERDGYMREIDSLAAWTPDIDFAFINVTGCHSHDTLALAEGSQYTLEQLKAAWYFPTHGNNREYVYFDFTEKMKNAGVTSKAACPTNRGDFFKYKRSAIQ
jgi:L-ascorbate metabolism protein UlaG (beta-lactamase superfamily)